MPTRVTTRKTPQKTKASSAAVRLFNQAKNDRLMVQPSGASQRSRSPRPKSGGQKFYIPVRIASIIRCARRAMHDDPKTRQVSIDVLLTFIGDVSALLSSA